MIIQKTPTKIDKIVSLRIGQHQENAATQIKMDVSDWITVHPTAGFHILFKRPGEVQAQPVLSSLEGGILTWTVQAWETALIGVGYAEVRAIEAESALVAKSRVIPCSVEESIAEDGDVPPEYSGWVERVLKVADLADDLEQSIADGIEDIQAEGATQVGNVNTAGSTQVNAVQAKGEEVRNSIPSDYSTLSGDVTSLKSAINETNKTFYDEKILSDLIVEKIGHYTVAANGTFVSSSAYDTFAVDTSVLKTFNLNGSNIKVAGYYSSIPSLNDVAIDGARHLDLPQGSTTVPNGCNCLILSVLTGDSTYISATTGQETINKKLGTIDDQIDNLHIEGYTRVNQVMTGASTAGIYNGSHVAISTWTYKTFAVEPNTEYYVTGTEAVSCALWYQLDENDNPIKNSGVGSGNTNRTNIPVITESATRKIVVNSINTFTCSLSKKRLNYITGIAEEIDTDKYQIGTGKYKTIVDLHGSNNGTFNFTQINYNGATYKSCTDDITPLYMADVGYVGANHGFAKVYDATLADHGLTSSDIGKTCEISGNTWILLKVKSSSVFTVGCIITSGLSWVLWAGFKTVSPIPTTFNFGTSIAVTNIVLAQLYPSVKNIDVKVVQNDSDKFSVSEHYQIISPASGIQSLINNVGNNTNESIVEFSDPAIDVINLYTFTNNGACVITSNIKALIENESLKFFGATQSGAFTTSDYYAVPMTIYDSMRVGGVEQRFPKSSWIDETKPPIIYCQADGSLQNASKMFVQGVFVENRLNKILTEAGFISSARKMYPFAVQPDAPIYGSIINSIAFRLPIYKNDMDSNFKFVQYCKVGNSYYLFINSVGAVSGHISVPADMNGRKITTVVSKNATCDTSLVAGYVDITATGESYLLLKLDENA